MDWLKYWVCCFRSVMLIPKLARAEKTGDEKRVVDILGEIQALLNRRNEILKVKGII